MLTDAELRALEQSDAPEARALAKQMLEQRAGWERAVTEARDERDWDHYLMLHDSQTRGPALVTALSQVPDKTGKTALLRDWFSSCDALAPVREQLRAHLEDTDFFTDESGDGNVPDFPVVVYRGAWDDDDAEHALSWTTDRAFAERFCRGLTGMRARLVLGIYREDATPTIFRAVCTEAYGFLNDRAEHEVIAKTLRSVEPVSQLVRADG